MCLLSVVCPARCFCTGIFHEKKRRKTSALFGRSFSGAVVFPGAARYFTRPVKSPGRLYIYAPYSPPKLPFCPKISRKFWQKIIPQSPLKGDVGNGFRGIDGGKIRGYHPGQAQAKRPRPSEPAQAVQKGEVNVNTPSTAELLVQQAKEAERLRLKLQEVNRLAETCKDLDEFRRELDRLNKQQ